MTGKINSVVAQLKKKNLLMTSVHCIAHRLHLAGQDVAKEVVYFKEYVNMKLFANNYRIIQTNAKPEAYARY
ncbi:uncharacterized protein OCT59_026545 [Rhizophagus irregularis]|nr:hypothetical protein OCT59_026545 [Rhizophagus irregularis]GBC16721.2 hypothetical protein GLOIN_2v1849188 [Rhizophagus irregularis DAOM 181602=DAOM 197198]